MNGEDGVGKARLIRLLASNYSAELDEDSPTLWLMLLAPYSLEDCRRAVLSVVRRYGNESVRFGSMPPFALLQRELDAVTGAVRGERNTALRAEAEWGRLLEEIRRCGAWREPELHPTTAFVVRQMGGWGAVCRWKEEDVGWKKKEFCALWREVGGREKALESGAVAVARLESGGLRRVDGPLLGRVLAEAADRGSSGTRDACGTRRPQIMEKRPER